MHIYRHWEYLLASCLLCSLNLSAAAATSTPRALEQLAKRYQIDLRWHQPPTSSWEIVHFRALSQDELKSEIVQAYLGYFNSEFSKYPLDLIQSSHLKSVAFVTDLKVNGQRRAAMPDYFKEILYLDPFVGVKNPVYQRHVIHHEFFHLLEEQWNGNAYYLDPNWAKLNPASFNYGTGGVNAQTGNVTALLHPQAGFINGYSMSGMIEDRAEIFAALLIPEEAAKLKAWRQQDTYLNQKINYLQSFLAKHAPSMDAAYWKQN